MVKGKRRKKSRKGRTHKQRKAMCFTNRHAGLRVRRLCLVKEKGEWKVVPTF